MPSINKAITSSCVTQTGVIYAGTKDELLKSTDDAVTWASLKSFSNASEFRTVYCAANGYIYVSAMNSYGAPFMDQSLTGLWRSTDGTHFFKVLTLRKAESIWGMDEDSNGIIYAGVYQLGKTNNARIYKSTDNGTTFFEVYDGGPYRHVHTIAVDKSNDYVYAGFGDTGTLSTIRRSSDGGITWEVILEGYPTMAAILVTPSARLLGSDYSNIGRIYRTTDDTNAIITLDGYYQNCFFLRRNPVTGNICAGFKLDPSATFPLKCELYLSKDDGLTWKTIERLEGLAPGEGFWFASNFYNNRIYVANKIGGVYQNGVEIIDADLPAAHLVGYWKFDEGDGSTAADSSGQGNDGVLTDGPAWIQAKHGNGLSFDGVDDYVDAGINHLEPTNVTISLWVKRRSDPKAPYKQTFVCKAINQTNTLPYASYVLSYGRDNSQELEFFLGFTDDTIGMFTTSGGMLELNKWYHVAATYDGSRARIYVNGSLKCDQPASKRIKYDPTYCDSLKIGSKPMGAPERDFFDGVLDDVRIYNRALTEEEVAELNEGFESQSP